MIRFWGKGVVKCADTPGFLGNRVGVFALQAGLHEALQMGVAIEAADALFSRPMGIPKTGIFGLYDLIGIDLMSDVATSCLYSAEKKMRFRRRPGPGPDARHDRRWLYRQ